MKILLAGWFSLEGGGATAGDLLVRDAVSTWLQERDIPHDVAVEQALGRGVDWFRISPSHYTHLVFACGPVGPELAVCRLIERFACCKRIGINVSLVGDPTWRPFDLILERDGEKHSRPDLAISQPSRSAPVVALVQIHNQARVCGGVPQDRA